MTRLITIFILIMIVYFTIKSMFKPVSRSSNSSPGPNKVQDPKDSSIMHEDPQCGTYVSEEDAIKEVIDGKALHFCSEQCLDKFKTSQ